MDTLLTAQQFKVAKMVVGNGLKQRQISHRTGLSQQSISQLWRAAVRKYPQLAMPRGRHRRLSNESN